MKIGMRSAAGTEPLPALAGGGFTQTNVGRLILRVTSGDHVRGWADQAVVSAANFLTLVMIGRWTDAGQLGRYAIGLSVLALLLATQESLVTRPYSIQLHRPPGTPAQHAFCSLVLSILLSSLGLALLCAAGLAFDALLAERELAQISWVLAAAAPFVLLREFARRFAFAHLRLSNALLLDVAVAAVNVAALTWLGWTGRLSAISAFAALALSCAIGGIGWLYLARNEFAFRLAQLRPTLKHSFRLGKWLLSSHLAIQAQGYTTHWLAMAIGGAAATGVYAASMSIVGFTNPLLLGFYNVLGAKSVRALRTGGGAGLRRQAAQDTLLLTALMSAFCVVLVVFGEDVMRLLYAGSEYQKNGHILAVLGLGALAAAIGGPASIALGSAERAHAVAAVTAGTAILNVGLVWWLMTDWGLMGAAYGILAAAIAGSMARWIMFLALVPAANASVEGGAP